MIVQPRPHIDQSLPCPATRLLWRSDGKWTVIGSRKDLYHAGTGQFAGYLYAEVRWCSAGGLMPAHVPNSCSKAAQQDQKSVGANNAIRQASRAAATCGNLHATEGRLFRAAHLPQAHDIQNSRYVFTDASNTTCESALAAVPNSQSAWPGSNAV